jgi:hypothetical protein
MAQTGSGLRHRRDGTKAIDPQTPQMSSSPADSVCGGAAPGAAVPREILICVICGICG